MTKCILKQKGCIKKYEVIAEFISPGEELKGEKDSGYRGKQTVTRDGDTCQQWHSMNPHDHKSTPELYPKAGIEGKGNNFCRNPGA